MQKIIIFALEARIKYSSLIMEEELDFDILESKVLEILEKYQHTEYELISLTEEAARLKNKLREAQAHNISLTEEVKRLKVANAMSGNEDYKRMMKLKMTKLINEVDTCIAQIKTNR